MSALRSTYKPPFVWFGGKSAVAGKVWAGLGDVDNYVEPFFGSGACLFLRPGGAGKVETVNDADGLLCNFWRALAADPDAVADHADYPVSECDLHARHLWLLGERARITERLCGDPGFCDARAAGWWVWGLNCWIGSGWCSGRGPWVLSDAGEMVARKDGDESTDGVGRKRPSIGFKPRSNGGGQGVLRNTGQGVNRKLPHLRNTGQGVNRQLPRLGNTGKGAEPETPTARRAWLRAYLAEFAGRLARVRVCCGDWARVCGPSVTYKHGTTGVFLDPPYADSAARTSDLYAVDCGQVAHKAREWAIAEGENPLMRIVLAGYEGEHAMPDSWTAVEWEAVGGYGLIADDEDGALGRGNKGRERLWFSPHCLNPERIDSPLFAGSTP